MDGAPVNSLRYRLVSSSCGGGISALLVHSGIEVKTIKTRYVK